MAHQQNKPLVGVVISEHGVLTLYEFSCACTVHVERVRALVEEGIIDPQGRGPDEWRFSAEHLRRARTAMRLQDELEVNLAGAALALDLMEELALLRQRLARLERGE